MRTAFFSHQLTWRAGPTRGRVAPPSDPGPALEQQQALLVGVLRRAGGVPVSYADLNDAGVEFPASVVSELELAGVAIERCYTPGPGSRRLLGVRLAPAADRDPRPVGAGAPNRPISGVARRRDWEPVRVYRTGAARALLEGVLLGVWRLVATGRTWAKRAVGGRANGSHMLAPLALLAATGVAAAVVVSALPGSGGVRAHSAHARYHAPAVAPGRAIAARRPSSATATNAARPARPSTPAGSTSTTSAARPPAATTSPPTPQTPATQPAPASPSSAPASPSSAPASPSSATDLEARGHELMVAGQYVQAVPVLQRALRATGEQPGACMEPTTQTCLTYAFALYDLGRSLRLAGDPAAAVPILKHRLQIDNQRPVVAAELVQASQQASRKVPNRRR